MPDAAETMAPPAAPAIEGSSAAAILLMLLDENEAATILKHLEPNEVRQLAKSMFDTANASEQQIGQALDRFVVRSRDVSALAIGATKFVGSAAGVIISTPIAVVDPATRESLGHQLEGMSGAATGAVSAATPQ